MDKEITFTYPLLYRIVYKYGVIAFNVLLVIYLLSTLAQKYTLFSKIYLCAIIIIGFLMFNGFILGVIKQTPYRIIYKNASLILDNFFLSRKSIKLQLKSISDINGGLITGKQNKSITLTTTDGKAFMLFPSIKRHSELLTLILNGVEKSVYTATVEKMKKNGLKV